ncbi:DUF1697 domain-containing protein [Chitinophaga solisilvae]|uniref:DUF1697 domain-containing protein n=1 Tax=Chitinophaga solisilvae TaxID=1233460 RepID=UPI001367EBD0|nr:DUF1697 domain-containing protein [Chitinophaga solisilvae]
MARYVAFLRAINVGGNRMVKMEVLKDIFEQHGFRQVQTYINSGNVLFDHTGKDTAIIGTKIEKALEKALGFDAPVCVRSMAEMAAVLENNPFPGITPDKQVQIYIAFLRDTAGADAAGILAGMDNEWETYRLCGREVFVLARKRPDPTPFSNNYLEKKLKVVATTRNLATATKVTQ